MFKNNIDWEAVWDYINKEFPRELRRNFTDEQIELAVQATWDFIKNEQIGPVSTKSSECVSQICDFVVQNLHEAFDESIPCTGMMMQLNMLREKNNWDLEKIKAYAAMHGYHQLQERGGHLFPIKDTQQLAA